MLRLDHAEVPFQSLSCSRSWRASGVENKEKEHTFTQPMVPLSGNICYASDASVAKLVALAAHFGFSTAS